jgi:hypothetical protein
MIMTRLPTRWNPKRQAAEFTRREIYPLDHHAVDALLADLGTARPSVHSERGPAYERSRPNELWHIDINGPVIAHSGRALGRHRFAEPARGRLIAPMSPPTAAGPPHAQGRDCVRRVTVHGRLHAREPEAHKLRCPRQSIDRPPGMLTDALLTALHDHRKRLGISSTPCNWVRP